MRWTARALVAGVLLVLCAAPAGAADAKPPFAVSPAELVLDWNEINGDSGAEFIVVNDSAGDRRPEFVFGRLLSDNEQPLCNGCLVAEFKVKPARISPGRERTVRVRVRKIVPPPTPGDGSYSGTLAIFDTTSGAFARVMVTVVVPNREELAAAKPLGDKATMTVQCRRLFHTRCTQGRVLWLPLATDVNPGGEHGEKLSLKPGRVGAVSGDHGSGELRFTGNTRTAEDGGPAIELRLDGLGHPGAYEGKIDLVPTDDKAGEITVKATVKTKWWWFLLAVFIGVAFASFVLWFVVGNKLLALRRRVAEALAAIDDAKAKFGCVRGSRQPWADYDLSKFPVEAERVATQIAAARRTKLFSLPEAEAKAIDEAITRVAAGAVALGDLDDDLARLEAKLKDVASRCSSKPPFPPSGDPPLAAETRKLYEKRQVDSLGDVADLRQLVEAKIAFVTAWRDYECDLAKLRDQAQSAGKLADVEPLISQTFTQLLMLHDEGDLAQTKPELDKMINTIRATVAAPQPTEVAEDEEPLTGATAGLRGLLNAAREIISSLLTVGYQYEAPSAAAPIGAAVFVLILLVFGVAVAVAVAIAGSTAVVVAAAAAAVLIGWWMLRRHRPPDRVRSLKWQEFWRNAILATVALVLALVTAANALYVDKPWGSRWDYVNAILWGGTARATLDLLLLPAIEQLAGLRPLAGLLRRR